MNNYVPRGFILLLDFYFAVVAAYLSFWLISTTTGSHFQFFGLNWNLWIIVLLQVVFYMLFRSYAGLIRYSSLNDAWKQFKVVALNVVLLLIINQVCYAIFESKLIVNAGVIVYGVFAFCFLFLFRVVVKSIYSHIQKKNTSQKAFILGTGPQDVAAASSLIAQKSDAFSIVGFISEQNQMLRNHIFNLPIVALSALTDKRRDFTAIIIREDKLKDMCQEETSVLSVLLEMDFKIFKFPKLQDWREFSDTGVNELQEIKIEDLLRRSPIKLNNHKLFSIYKDKVVLVSGAAGSIGSEIVRQLAKFKPKEILLVDKAETPLHNLGLELDSDYPDIECKRLIGDVRNKKRMGRIFEDHRPQIVFHAAAYKHVPMMEANPGEAINVNFKGTRFMAELAVDYEIERFVFISTDKAVNPTNIMGATKRAAEIFIQSLSRQKRIGTTFMTTRFGNVLGSNGSVVPHFKKQIAAGGPITVTHPDITRYFMTIDEACQLVLEAGGIGRGGEIFVFDMGQPIKILDLAKQMIRLSGLIPEKDIPVKIVGLRPGEKLYEELLADRETTTETYHDKILIGEATYQFDKSKLNLLNGLLEMSQNYNLIESLAILKELVPEYRSDKTLLPENRQPKPSLKVEGSN